MRNLKYYLPGSLLILIAIIIAAVPEIHIAVLAAFIIMVGIGALKIGHMIRKSEIENRDFDSRFVVDNPTEVWLKRAPIATRWYRKF